MDSGEDLLKVWDVIWPWFQHFYESYRADPPRNPNALLNQTYVGRMERTIISYPGDKFKSIASITISIKDEEEKIKKFQFKTIGRDRETAMDVCYGRAWHFHKKYLALGK